MASVLGLCNPLLDICADIDKELLEKYQLKENDAILASEVHFPLYNELVENHSVQYIAGGSAQNSLRVLQWLLPRGSRCSTFIGCVGEDKYAQVLKEAAENDGLNVRYMTTSRVPTGTCAVLVHGKHRSLVANLSAANEYHVSHLLEQKQWELVTSTSIFYVSGFFFTVSPESILTLAKHAAENNKIFCQNLSAPFVCQFFKEPMDQAVPYWDIVFGNESEAVAFAEAHAFDSKSVPQIAMRIANLPKINQNRPRIVVITQGADPTIVAIQGQGHTQQFPVPTVDANEIVDTNGCGDAFVGGFLAGLVNNSGIDKCIEAGAYAAGIIIRRSGCTLPKECGFAW